MQNLSSNCRTGAYNSSDIQARYMHSLSIVHNTHIKTSLVNDLLFLSSCCIELHAELCRAEAIHKHQVKAC